MNDHCDVIIIGTGAGGGTLLNKLGAALFRLRERDFEKVRHVGGMKPGLRFQGGSSGVRFIRGHHTTLEDCEIFETGNNALTVNSGDCTPSSGERCRFVRDPAQLVHQRGMLDRRQCPCVACPRFWSAGVCRLRQG